MASNEEINNVVTGKLKYANILHVSFLTIFLDQAMRYFAKINTQPGLPKAVYVIISILMLIQLIGPSFYVDSTDLWNHDSVFSYFMRSIGCIWHLWAGQPRLVASLIISLLILVYNGALIALIIRFSKRQIASRVEGLVNIFFAKYVVPLLLVLACSEFPHCIDTISDSLSIAYLVFFLIAILASPYMIYLASCRILVENNPFHEWHASYPTLFWVVCAVLVVFGTAVNLVKREIQAVFICINAVIYALFGVYNFIFAPTFKRIPNILITAFCFAGCALSIIDIILLFVENVNEAVIVFLFIILLLISYIAVHFINKRRLTNILMVFNQCENAPDDAEDIIFRAYKSPTSFMNAVHIVFTSWPPYLISWKPFSAYLQKFPDNANLCLLWCRICALFPQEHELFRWLINQYSNMKPQVGRTTYLIEMISIQSSRFTDTTPAVLKSISYINRLIANANALQSRFWDRILQKSTEMFWSDIGSIRKITEKIQIEINQLLDSYPNNADIVDLYCSFLQNVKADYIAYKEWEEKLEQLKAGTSLHQDFALQAARFFLPELQHFCVESSPSPAAASPKKDEDLLTTADKLNTGQIHPSMLSTPAPASPHETNVNSTHPTFQINETNNIQQEQVKISLQRYIKKSKVGGILLGTIILIIGTALSIGVFVYYVNSFNGDLIEDIVSKEEFMQETNIALMNLEYLSICVGLHPLNLLNKWKPCSSTNPDGDCARMMRTISPLIYPSGRLPNWILDEAYIGSVVASARSQLLNIQYSLNNLSSAAANSIYARLYVEPFMDDMPIIQVLTKYFIDGQSLTSITDAQSFLSNPLFSSFDMNIHTIVEELIKFPNEMYQISAEEADTIIAELKQNFILVVFVTFFLISLPLVLSNFVLVMESNTVSNAFISLPNTAVREILQSKDIKNSSKSSSSHAIAISSNSDSTWETLKIYLIFILSCGCIFGASLYLYYEASLFSDIVNIDLLRISSLHHVAIYSLAAAFRMVRLTLNDIINSDFPEYSSYDIGYNRSTQISIAEQNLLSLRNGIQEGIWGLHGTVNSYYNANIQMDYFTDIIPSIVAENISQPLTKFEDIAILDILEEFEYGASNLQLWIDEAKADNYSSEPYESNYFLYYIYYYGMFAPNSRYTQFFEPVVQEVNSDFSSLSSSTTIVLIIVILFQILILFIMILFLYLKSATLKGSLEMLLFFNPTFVLQNQNVISLLTTGSKNTYAEENSYKDAERVIECTTESIILMDKKMAIVDVNDAFVGCIGVGKSEIIGKTITDLFKSSSQTDTVESIMLQLHEVLRGNGNPSFKGKMAVSTPIGEEKIVIVNILCLTQQGTATEADFAEINAIVFIIEDQTEHQLIEQRIQAEKQKITEMLNRVMPSVVVEELQKGADSIALAVQSATVACVKVSSATPFDKEDFNAPFQYFSKVFSILDEMMKEFPQLTKIRTFSHTYEYACGLFGSVNKPDKHAEIATRFALKIISSVKEIEDSIGHDVSFTIGLNTGGPLVAGVISLQNPTFHLIGPTAELAQRLKSTGIKNQIHVTRAVYELVYAYNFHVTERGDIDVGGGKVLRTYVIVP